MVKWVVVACALVVGTAWGQTAPDIARANALRHSRELEAVRLGTREVYFGAACHLDQATLDAIHVKVLERAIAYASPAEVNQIDKEADIALEAAIAERRRGVMPACEDVSATLKRLVVEYRVMKADVDAARAKLVR